MKIETIPLIVGAVVGLLGLLLLFDAWTPDETVVPRERRRAARSERSRGGETAIGFGVLCLAAAILGRDTWRYTIVSAIAGTVLVLLGGVMSRRYIRGRLVTYVDEPAVERGDAGPFADRELTRHAVRDGHLGPAVEQVGDAAPPDDAVNRPDAGPAPEKRLRIR